MSGGPAEEASAAPERFGPYELIGRLGRGGMAEVFRARLAEPGSRPDHPDVFALKRLLPEVMEDPDARADFLTEADVAPLLRHPNLVRVFASGEQDGRAYLVMELVEGTDIEALLVRRPNAPMPAPLACYIVAEALAGLHYLHGARGTAGTPLGLVHRDVTPANLFIDREGRVKLADLGVARLLGLERQSLSGGVKGKLRYLSPEQVVAAPIGPETDVFAAGAILFELLTGRFAFDQESELEVMTAIRDGRVPKLRKVVPGLPVGLEQVVSRALHRKLKKRYPTAAAFRDALDAVRFAHGLDIVADEAVEALAAWLNG